MIGNKRKPFKAPGKQTQSNPSIQVQIQIEEAKIRKLEILKSLQESNEIEKVQGLICKWREACIEAIGTIREKIGKTIIHQTTKSYQEEIGWDSKQAVSWI